MWIIPKALAERFPLIAYSTFITLIALSGGSSRYESASQPVARAAAIALIGSLLWRPSGSPSVHNRPALQFLAALTLLLLLQLVPLPPALWSALPGHDRYLAAALAAGEPQPWRPINLTPDRGYNSLFALLPPAAALIAGSRLNSRDQAAILPALILVVIGSAALGLAQTLAGTSDTLRLYETADRTASGLFANRNHQALLLACGLPMLAAWASRMPEDRGERRIKWVLAWAAASFLLLTIPATGSRSGLVLAIVALAGASVLSWPSIRSELHALPKRRRLAVGVSGLALLAAMIATALTFSRAEAVRRLITVSATDDARVRLLGPLVAMTRKFLPFGSGFGSFDPVYRGFERFDDLATTYMNQAHNDYLQAVLEGGLPALVLLLLFIGWWGWQTIAIWRRSSGHDGMLGCLGSALILLILLASATDYPIRTPLIMIILAQAALWMLSALKHDGRTRPPG